MAFWKAALFTHQNISIIREPRILFKVRFALHLILKRYDNRLLFDRQIKVSEMLGFEGEGNHGVEKMMKRFFQALRTISRLTDILIKHYKEHFLSTDGELSIHPWIRILN